MVLDNEQRLAKRRLIEENRLKRQKEANNCSHHDVTSDSAPPPPCHHEAMTSDDHMIVRKITDAYLSTMVAVGSAVSARQELTANVDARLAGPAPCDNVFERTSQLCTNSVKKSIAFAKQVPDFRQV